MAGADITLGLDVVGADVPAAVLNAVGRRAGDMTDVMTAIGDALVRSTHVRMEREQAPDGTAWQKSRRAAETGGRTLYKIGHLYQSITSQAGPDSVAVGSDVVYAAIHQFGGDVQHAARVQTIYRRLADMQAERPAPFVKRGRATFVSNHQVAAHTVTMPARPYLGVSADDQAEILAVVEDAFLLAMQDAGR